MATGFMRALQIIQIYQIVYPASAILQGTIIYLSMDKGTSSIVYEVKNIRRDINYRICAADVFNEFLYMGDDRGTHPTNHRQPLLVSSSRQ